MTVSGDPQLREDGARMEVVGGEIVVSPGPTVDHNGMVRDIEHGVFDGYIPDLIVMEADVLAEARSTKAQHLLPHQVDLVVEGGYAHAGIPYYLLVDRDPKIGNTTLYVDPDPATGHLHRAGDLDVR